MVFGGHTEEIGDRQQGERHPVAEECLELAGRVELIDQSIGELPHEVFVLVEPARCEQAAHQPSSPRMLRRIHGDQMLVHRKLFAVCVDLPIDVVAVHRER